MIPVILPESSSQPSSPQMYSTLQVVRALFAGAPVLPVLEEDAPPVASFHEMLDRVAEGNVRGVVVGTLRTFLRACGRIPMLHPVPDNADERRLIPVVCNFCNCAFCFPNYLASVLGPPPGLTYTRLPGPATPDLNKAPLVGSLCGVAADDGALPAAGGELVPLTVCPDRRHFAVAMGMMDLPHDARPVEWRRPAALGVVPVAVGTRPAGGGLQRKELAPVEGSSGATDGSASSNA